MRPVFPSAIMAKSSFVGIVGCVAIALALPVTATAQQVDDNLVVISEPERETGDEIVIACAVIGARKDAKATTIHEMAEDSNIPDLPVSIEFESGTIAGPAH